jgi:hypothetical protein
MKTTVRIFIALMISLMLVPPVQADTSADHERALAWLMTNQQDDGGFTTGFAEGSDLGATVEVILAAVAAGDDPRTWEPSPLDYLRSQVEAGAVTDAAGWSRVILGATALNADPRDLSSTDAISELFATQDSDTGQFGASLYAHAYALLALHNAGVELPQNAVDLLLETQTSDGSWPMNVGDSVDTNTTALAAQALVAAGETETAQRALSYYRAMQNADGGFPWQKPSDFGTETDANSTAVVVQALTALEAPMSEWETEGGTPLDALTALQEGGSGGYQWQAAVPGPNVLATAQAVQALSGMNLVELSTANTVEVTENVQLPESGGFVLGGFLTLTGLGALLAGLTLRKA